MESVQDKALVAGLAGAVLDSYAQRDPVATEILQEAADALSLGAERVAKQLDLPGCFPLVLTGGLLDHSPSYFDLVKRKIHGLMPGADVMPPKMRPVQGAVLHALGQTGVSITEEILRNLHDATPRDGPSDG
jgi:N-acetylglucosamine kinase-like BadF-type ATPase